MKFSDIPQLPQSYYSIDVPLDSVPRTLERYQEAQERFGYKFELNPDFQRGHVWTQEQQSSYMEWLLRGGTSGRDIYFNHTGWMTTYEGDMVCLDGLQRLTAITRFFANEITAFGFFCDEFEGSIGILPNQTVKFHVMKLQTKRDILNFYLTFNEAGTRHTQEELSRVRSML